MSNIVYDGKIVVYPVHTDRNKATAVTTTDTVTYHPGDAKFLMSTETGYRAFLNVLSNDNSQVVTVNGSGKKLVLLNDAFWSVLATAEEDEFDESWEKAVVDADKEAEEQENHTVTAELTEPKSRNKQLLEDLQKIVGDGCG